MPEDNPGGLTDVESTLVLAYIFRINGYPTGVDSLPTDTLAMKSIRISPPPADTDQTHASLTHGPRPP